MPAMPPAGRVPGPARGGNAARGHGQGGGITRTCPGSRCSGIFPGAGTAARNAGAVHAAGRSLVRGAAGLAGDRAAGGALPPPLSAGLRLPGAGDGDGAWPAEGGRQGPVHERVHRDAPGGAVHGGAEHGFPGEGPGPAGSGYLARDPGRDVRAGRGAAGPGRGGCHGAVAGLLAPARGRDDVAGLRAAGRERAGEVVAVGVPRPGHRVLRDGPDEVRGGAGPPRRHRRGHRPAHRGRGRRAAAPGDLQRLLLRLPVCREEGRRPGEPVLLGAYPQVFRPGRGREPRPADVLDRCVAGADQGPVRRPRGAHGRVERRRRPRAAGHGGRRHATGRRARRVERRAHQRSTRHARSRWPPPAWPSRRRTLAAQQSLRSSG